MIQTSGGRRAYNVFAIPLAAGVLAWQGILLPPALAAMLMSAAPSLWRSTPSF
jgi:P-type Cu2+ transporter